jgi:hypothetical protein
MRESWSMPKICCSCGGPADGTTATLSRCVLETHRTANVQSTTYLELKFPQCKACNSAQTGWVLSLVLGGIGSFFLGVALFWFFALRGIPSDAPLTGTQLGGLAMSAFGGLFLGGLLVREIWGLIAGAETRQRLELTMHDVVMRRREGDVIDFEFGDEHFAEAFAAANQELPRPMRERAPASASSIGGLGGAH